ncbi:MAG: hypothetical protein ACFCAD_20370 [Pleurocapsa sp.]
MKNKGIKYSAIALLSLLTLGGLFSLSVTTLNDPISKKLRTNTENSFNQYVDFLLAKAAKKELNSLDKAIMHIGTKTSIVATKFIYPEASVLLDHYVYGDGSDLKLPNSYFKTSSYLQNQIDILGKGEHELIALEQQEDWRLSLVFNPYFLDVTTDKVKIYHPQIEFAPVTAEKEPTFIAIGKMKLRVYDNLFSAMSPTPFYAYAEWENI